MTQGRWLIGFLTAFVIVMLFWIGYALTKERSAFSTQSAGTPNSQLTEPSIKITDPRIGPETAPVKIVYFVDFGSENSVLTWPAIQSLLAEPEFKNKIQFIWKDFPSHANIFPESLVLHRAARCAAVRGKFWEFQAAVFDVSNKIMLQEPVLDTILAQTHLAGAQMQSCIDSPAIATLIDENIHEGAQLGLVGTPAFFIGGKRFDGIPDYATFMTAIRNSLGTH